MLEGIDIANLGSFRGFQWDAVRDSGNNRVHFKKVNLLYGRNCAGKTTLSRILRALETGELPANYDAPAFTVHIDGGAVTQDGVVGTKRNVRVYNRDFIEKHLGILRSPTGNIETFAIFGAENKALEEEIAAKTAALGSVEGKSGLLFEQSNADSDHMSARASADAAANALDELLFKKANNDQDGIKHRPEFGDVTYTKTKLRADIELVAAGGHALNEADARNLALLINETQLGPQDKKVEFASDFPAIAAAATELLTRKIAPTRPLQELLNDALLQSWVQMGMGLHRDKRETCGFCHQPLPPELWAKLDAHFNEAAQTLALGIRVCQEAIQKELDALSYVQRIPRETVYAVHRDNLDRLNQALYDDVLRHQATLHVLREELKLRSGDIFSSRNAPATPNYANAIATTAAEINAVVAASNSTTASLGQQKTKAKRKLLLNEVQRFSSDINFWDTIAANGKLTQMADDEQERAQELSGRVRRLQGEIAALRDQQRDERRGAARINEFLQKHFGHSGLRLVADQDPATAKFKFQIVRGSEPAHNLSDGECSLVAFCYFLARLEDTDTQGTSPIIWIDDPISSLDSNHIYFLFSLIEAQIARPVTDAAGAEAYRYGQLFISTHNLEFLKYLRRLKLPGSKEKEWLRHYLVAKRDAGSIVECMPEYLVKYTTEFNFLFGEICTCVNPANQATNLQAFYNFGANLRRFLEAYLYFKYPFADGTPDQDFTMRIKLFFGNGLADDAFIARMAHEGAHLMGQMDRAMQPIERDEISKAARMVLDAIKAADKDQYASLLRSIKQPCPL